MFKRHAASAQTEADGIHQGEGLQVFFDKDGEVLASERGDCAGSVAERTDWRNQSYKAGIIMQRQKYQLWKN